MRKRFFSAVMAAMMLSLASVGAVSASAAETTDSAVEVSEQATTAADNDNSEDGSETEGTMAKATETSAEESSSAAETTVSSVSEEEYSMEDFMKVMAQLAENGNGTVIANDSRPDYDGDPYYDTDGNATLIKSEQIIYNTEEMQFIAVTTKDGHVFYVLINYTAESGEDNVYFLNKVDDYDLYALLYAGDEDKDGNPKYTPEEAAQAAEKANGRVNSDDNSSDTAETSEATADGEGAEDGENAPTKKAPANMSSIYLVGIIALIGFGAGGFFLFKKKKGDNGVRKPEFDPDDYKSDDDDDLEIFDGNDSYDDE
ncbi:DUF4366 domain-containing protein [Ruminococcus bicirculans]|uniref:DUF4366 domain-containing protein n=1 Tax=Ruminococcus bicirculans (ex Wegman et al. 2014) TaxID=1160721 RepID=A0AAW6EGU8_9FIRM|nr:DUF4366 domain-containing protein [Ruminococcus bicirculans (ex Wegman et al. 2014)]MDB8751068.1 DUF4366 domain-containing protein [Ruminococcus bicirculans (ex Wegman et al. 2014)]